MNKSKSKLNNYSRKKIKIKSIKSIKSRKTKKKKELIQKELNKNFFFYGVELDKGSRNKLLNVLQNKIPKGWTKIANHMSIIVFIKNNKNLTDKQNNLILKIIKDIESNKNIKLKATHIGIIDKVKTTKDNSLQSIAVKVKGYESINNVPHITVAVGPYGRASHSKKIQRWRKLKTPFNLIGKIQGYKSKTARN